MMLSKHCIGDFHVYIRLEGRFCPGTSEVVQVVFRHQEHLFCRQANKKIRKKTGLRETHTVNKFPETRQILSYDKENLWHRRDSLANFKSFYLLFLSSSQSRAIMMNPRWSTAFFTRPCLQFLITSGQVCTDRDAVELIGECNHMIRFSSPKQL